MRFNTSKNKFLVKYYLVKCHLKTAVEKGAVRADFNRNNTWK